MDVDAQVIATAPYLENIIERTLAMQGCMVLGAVIGPPWEESLFKSEY
jgi:hypothetical protein